MKLQPQKICKILYLSVLISLFSPIQAFAKNRIVPQTQTKVAPAVSPEQTSDQIQDNFQQNYQDGYQDNYQANYQENYQDNYQQNNNDNYPAQNMQNQEDIAYLDREIQNVPQVPAQEIMPKYEENSAQLSDGGYAESEFQN